MTQPESGFQYLLATSTPPQPPPRRTGGRQVHGLVKLDLSIFVAGHHDDILHFQKVLLLQFDKPCPKIERFARFSECNCYEIGHAPPPLSMLICRFSYGRFADYDAQPRQPTKLKHNVPRRTSCLRMRGAPCPKCELCGGSIWDQ